MIQHQSNNDLETLQFMNFFVADQAYCVRLDTVQEIRGWSKLTALPHAQAAVLGVLNLRGTVIPIYDLAVSLGIGRTEQQPRSVIIVVRFRGGAIGLLVDSVASIESIPSEDIQPAPELATGSDTAAIEGLIGSGETLKQIIDLEATIQEKEAVTH